MIPPSLTTRTITILYAINKRKYDSYLELGCSTNATFDAVECKRKVGVDSVEGGTLRMSTDEFFVQNQETFDIIFIDANHHHDQVFKDFNSSLKILNAGGVIIMHDCNPINVAYEAQNGCGTVWRTFARHVRTRHDLDSIVGDYDHGVGLVRVAPNQDVSTLTTDMDELTFNDLKNNRSQLLRLRTWESVMEWL